MVSANGGKERGGSATVAVNPPAEHAPSSVDAIPKVGGYEIQSELGRGAMGVVYKAVQTALGRSVALKMILVEHAQGAGLVRFMSEAEAVARFQHPNIVQIYEVGEAEGRPFFSLEYVEGGNLEEKLGGKPQPWREAAELVAVLARAIHAAHGHGIIHRDLKPANILLTADGRPKIADFGIAKRLDAQKQTQTGQIIGTPSYMAPEQAVGGDVIGPGTDVYALGVILYDLLTGRPPFESASALDTIMQVVLREPISPRELQPTIPRDLETICLKCLEKKSEKRYASALELADDLERCRRNEPIQARPIGSLERAWRWARREPAWATLIGVSLIGLVGFVATGAWFTRKLQHELRATQIARQDATSARDELRLRLVRGTAERIDGDLRRLAGVPGIMAVALRDRSDWTDAQLDGWLRSALAAEPRIFGMAVAFEPEQFRRGVADYALYVFRGARGLEGKQLVPPEYTPIYREWEWYRRAPEGGRWSDPYVDKGGGDIPMVTFSMPFQRGGRRAGVVTVDLSLEYFRALGESIRHSQFSSESHAFVATRDGTIIAHPDPKIVFPAPAAQRTKPNGGASAALWSRILGGETGAERGEDFATGKAATLLFAPVVSASWACVAVVPERETSDAATPEAEMR
jgi:hypothetical protein